MTTRALSAASLSFRTQILNALSFPNNIAYEYKSNSKYKGREYYEVRASYDQVFNPDRCHQDTNKEYCRAEIEVWISWQTFTLRIVSWAMFF
jgi:hypothetical protein